MAADPYSVLGLTREATKADINRAFRRLAKQHHPDVNQGNKSAEEHFKRLTAAYDVLTGKDPGAVEIAPPAGYDRDYVAELESRVRAQRDRIKKSEGVFASFAALFRAKRG
jgi:curved DNA-binding protein CbpA